jgi:HK97 family phage prohead protease
MTAIECKHLGGHILETKKAERNGVPVGIVEGYIATWDVDEGSPYSLPDQFIRGAFAESLAEHRSRKNRQVRLRYMHSGGPIGGLPIDGVREDEKGLFGVGEVNLTIERGAEAYSLAQQGVIVDQSIEFSAHVAEPVQGVRVIRRASLWGTSLIDEPMNRAAQITAVKSLVPFADLPVALGTQEWVQLEPADRRKGSVWSTSDASATIAGLVDGELMVIPDALKGLAAAIQSGHWDHVSHEDRNGIIRHIERYYAKMGEPSPFAGDEKRFFTSADVKGWTARQLERALASCGSFSNDAAALLVARLKTDAAGDRPSAALKNLLAEITATRTSLHPRTGGARSE